ncbi:zincin, partial [Backusella circina FSU 941]
VDLSIDPCDNFYEYTCSNWEKAHDIPDGKSSINSFVILQQENKEVLRNIFSHDFDDFYQRTHSSSGHLPDPEKLLEKQNFEKVKDMYDACMDENSIDNLGPEPIFPLLHEIQSLYPASGADDTRKVTQTLTYLAKHAIGVLFDIYIDADQKDPNQNVLQLYQSGLTLPSKVYYTKDDTIEVFLDGVKETFDAVFNHPNSPDKGWDKYRIDQMARMVINFEKKLAELSQLPEELQDPEATYNLMSLKEITAIAPSVLWEYYIDQLLPRDAPRPEKIVISSPTYIGNVSKTLLEKVNVRDLQAYFIWRAIYTYADALGEDVRKPLRKLNSKLVGTDPKAIKPRWDTCLDEINSIAGFLSGRYFVLEKFGGDAKSRADEFVNSIKQAFLERLPKLSWLDDETRTRAVEKVNKLIRKVGYPDKTPDVMSPVSLSEYYSDLKTKRGDYFSNYLESRLWAVRDQWREIDKIPDRRKWFMNPQEVNAYYNPSFNEIVFPAGILQSPFFGNNAPDYLNYGGIGAVVGHELTHGFDNMGKHFDGEGRLIQWWTEETSKAFDAKAKCFIEQYSNFTVEDEFGEEIHVNGRLTLGENLADNGGLGESYVAWKKKYDSNKENKDVRLPGLDNLSPEQLFFVNFGRIWCNKATKAQAKKGVLTDEHSPAKWRVNGAIQNSKYFAEVFNCPLGSLMNPVHKCELW